MHTPPGGNWYFQAGGMLLVSLMCFLAFGFHDWEWQWLAMGVGALVLAILFHMYLAWWRDRFELYFPGMPDDETTRYHLFMDRCARKIAWRLGIRWDRPPTD